MYRTMLLGRCIIRSASPTPPKINSHTVMAMDACDQNKSVWIVGLAVLLPLKSEPNHDAASASDTTNAITPQIMRVPAHAFKDSIIPRSRNIVQPTVKKNP